MLVVVARISGRAIDPLSPSPPHPARHAAAIARGDHLSHSVAHQCARIVRCRRDAALSRLAERLLRAHRRRRAVARRDAAERARRGSRARHDARDRRARLAELARAGRALRRAAARRARRAATAPSAPRRVLAGGARAPARRQRRSAARPLLADGVDRERTPAGSFGGLSALWQRHARTPPRCTSATATALQRAVRRSVLAGREPGARPPLAARAGPHRAAGQPARHRGARRPDRPHRRPARDRHRHPRAARPPAARGRRGSRGAARRRRRPRTSRPRSRSPPASRTPPSASARRPPRSSSTSSRSPGSPSSSRCRRRRSPPPATCSPRSGAWRPSRVSTCRRAAPSAASDVRPRHRRLRRRSDPDVSGLTVRDPASTVRPVGSSSAGGGMKRWAGVSVVLAVVARVVAGPADARAIGAVKAPSASGSRADRRRPSSSPRRAGAGAVDATLDGAR